jgi:hypothetical protein
MTDNEFYLMLQFSLSKKWTGGVEPTTCGSEDPKCNNKEISHRSSQDRSLPNNNNNSPQIMGLKPLVLFHDWLQSQGKTKTIIKETVNYGTSGGDDV